MSESGTPFLMPEYKCHKVVRAARVTGHPCAGSVEIEVGDARVVISTHVKLGADHDIVGGYLVQYRDGYISWSPAAEFEAGYTAVEP